MLESDVQPILRALRAHGLDVVAIHHHMINLRPVIIFLHYWEEVRLRIWQAASIRFG